MKTGRKRRLLLLLTLPWLWAAPSFASGDTTRTAALEEAALPPPPELVAAFLELSESQRTQFQFLLHNVVESTNTLTRQRLALEHQMQELLGSETPDPTSVGKLFLDIHNVQQQVAQVLRHFQESFRLMLRPDQLEKVQAVAGAAPLQPFMRAFSILHLIPAGSQPEF
ncbi:MAG: hypothetical protein AB1898_21415 [Acidobacteriota bacterium]